jgi:O-antigen/teichoic acid export membrane protein
VLANYLRLFALDLPLFAVSQSHLQVLVGLGQYRQRAVVSATRWLARLGLILLLVGCGLSVPGAILASLGTSVVELAIGRYFIRPSLFTATAVSSRRLWDYAVPLFLSALSLRLFRLDQFALKALRGTAEQAGYYGAAQNLAYVPSMFGLTLAPLLLSTLTRVLREGNPGLARALARDTMRLVLLLLPLAALMAGARSEIVQLIFGPQFVATAPLLAWLVWPAIALTMVSVTGAILTAAGHPRWTFALVGPLVPLAVAGQLWLVPRYGPLGAAAVTTVLAIIGALAGVLAVGRLWHILPPLTSLLRSAALGGLVYLLAAQWPTPGWWVVPKLAGLGAGTVLGYLALGEFSRREIGLAWSLLASLRQPAAGRTP